MSEADSDGQDEISEADNDGEDEISEDIYGRTINKKTGSVDSKRPL